MGWLLQLDVVAAGCWFCGLGLAGMGRRSATARLAARLLALVLWVGAGVAFGLGVWGFTDGRALAERAAAAVDVRHADTLRAIGQAAATYPLGFGLGSAAALIVAGALLLRASAPRASSS